MLSGTVGLSAGVAAFLVALSSLATRLLSLFCSLIVHCGVPLMKAFDGAVLRRARPADERSPVADMGHADLDGFVRAPLSVVELELMAMTQGLTGFGQKTRALVERGLVRASFCRHCRHIWCCWAGCRRVADRGGFERRLGDHVGRGLHDWTSGTDQDCGPDNWRTCQPRQPHHSRPGQPQPPQHK